MKENLIILGRCGLKYTDELGAEYFVDGEMIVSNEYDYVMWTDSIMCWEDHIQQSNPENIGYTERYDKKTDTSLGQVTYKKDFREKLSHSKKQEIAERIRKLTLRDNCKLEIL